MSELSDALDRLEAAVADTKAALSKLPDRKPPAVLDLYQCSKCKKRFASAYSLLDHVEGNHR